MNVEQMVEALTTPPLKPMPMPTPEPNPMDNPLIQLAINVAKDQPAPSGDVGEAK